MLVIKMKLYEKSRCRKKSIDENRARSARSILRSGVGINRDLFLISLVLYIFLFILETVKPGFVSFFFNINILVLVILISGFIMVFSTALKPENEVSIIDEIIEKQPILYVAIIAIIFTVLLFLASNELGRAVYPLFIGMGIELLILLEALFTGSSSEEKEVYMGRPEE
ncbi:MAG: hypothetical protein JW738_09580 [Actinobacteria bacterium]|nr:hypothetical protein [Actinomycetota bacterium]